MARRLWALIRLLRSRAQLRQLSGRQLRDAGIAPEHAGRTRAADAAMPTALLDER